MNKFLSVLVTGLIAGSLSLNAFALDAAKPVVAATKTQAKKVVAVKKDSSIKAAVKKANPSIKKTDVKPK